MAIENEQRYLDEVDKRLENIRTKEELVDFIRLIAHGYDAGYEEQQPLSEYLGGFAGLTLALEPWYKNMDLELPEKPNWNVIAQLLVGSFDHS